MMAGCGPRRAKEPAQPSTSLFRSSWVRPHELKDSHDLGRRKPPSPPEVERNRTNGPKSERELNHAAAQMCVKSTVRSCPLIAKETPGRKGDRMTKDIRYAIRALMKAPGFFATTVLTLALGIGANSAIFSVVNQVLLNPGGITNPERIVALRVKYDKLALASIPVSVPDFADVKASTDLFENAAIQGSGAYNYTASGVPERLRGATVSAGWVGAFRAKPHPGRAVHPQRT